MDRSKTRVRKTKKGRSGGLLNNLQSEGRERRRRRAEDVGVVLGEAARVRDVGLGCCCPPETAEPKNGKTLGRTEHTSEALCPGTFGMSVMLIPMRPATLRTI